LDLGKALEAEDILDIQAEDTPQVEAVAVDILVEVAGSILEAAAVDSQEAEEDMDFVPGEHHHQKNVSEHLIFVSTGFQFHFLIHSFFFLQPRPR
jgi:hypothetical protein